MGERRPAREQIAWRRAQTEAMLAFSRVHQQILLATASRLEEAGIERITPARANALIVLFNARRPIQAQQLAVELGVSDVTVSRVLRRMEEDGWVERTPDPQDGRAMLIQPTAYARGQFGTLVRVSNSVLDDLFGALPPESLEGLMDQVSTIQAALSARLGGAERRGKPRRRPSDDDGDA
jgi:DNA-binding MarR family transcriptional regulator